MAAKQWTPLQEGRFHFRQMQRHRDKTVKDYLQANPWLKGCRKNERRIASLIKLARAEAKAVDLH